MGSKTSCMWRLMSVVSVAGAVAAVHADPYDPPPSYYAGATGTGATLKAQLTAAMSAGHIQRSYGDFRYSAAIHDADPNVPGKVLLCYNRASVNAGWDNGITWNREHVWPQSLQPGDASNSSKGNLGDPHALRPCNPSINSSRGNKPFAYASTFGLFGSQGSYYFPGDEDKGDFARCLFYSDTRWSSLGIALVNTFPGGNQMGNLDSLIAWNYLDPPDDFERGRNHRIYSSALNPQYYTNNRNAYIDNPWFIWSIYVDQANDSTLFVSGTSQPDGSSTITVPFPDLLVGDTLSGTMPVTLFKVGTAGTYFSVTPGPGATSSITGPYNAFPMTDAGDDARAIDVGFDAPDTSTSGLLSADVTIDNLDITTGGGTGHGGNDGDDVITLTVNVLDHANASFHPVNDEDFIAIDLGTITQGSGDAMVAFDLYNLEANPGFTAALDVDPDTANGDTATLITTMSTVDALTGSQTFIAALDDAAVGSFGAMYTFRTFDDRGFPTALEGPGMTILLTGSVIPVECVGDYNGDLVVDFDDLNVVLLNFGTGYDFDDLNLVLSNWMDDCSAP